MNQNASESVLKALAREKAESLAREKAIKELRLKWESSPEYKAKAAAEYVHAIEQAAAAKELANAALIQALEQAEQAKESEQAVNLGVSAAKALEQAKEREQAANAKAEQAAKESKEQAKAKAEQESAELAEQAKDAYTAAANAIINRGKLFLGESIEQAAATPELFFVLNGLNTHKMKSGTIYRHGQFLLSDNMLTKELEVNRHALLFLGGQFDSIASICGIFAKESKAVGTLAAVKSINGWLIIGKSDTGNEVYQAVPFSKAKTVKDSERMNAAKAINSLIEHSTLFAKTSVNTTAANRATLEKRIARINGDISPIETGIKAAILNLVNTLIIKADSPAVEQAKAAIVSIKEYTSLRAAAAKAEQEQAKAAKEQAANPESDEHKTALADSIAAAAKAKEQAEQALTALAVRFTSKEQAAKALANIAKEYERKAAKESELAAAEQALAELAAKEQAALEQAAANQEQAKFTANELDFTI